MELMDAKQMRRKPLDDEGDIAKPDRLEAIAMRRLVAARGYWLSPMHATTPVPKLEGKELLLDISLAHSTAPMVLLASGTGFAPIKALMEHMQHKGISRPTRLYWGGRRPADLYLNDWVLAQLPLMPNLQYIPVVSDALPEDAWTGRTGFVHSAVLQDTPSLSGYQVYACGAPIVVDSARRDYIANGLSEDEFFADSFTSEADKAQG